MNTIKLINKIYFFDGAKIVYFLIQKAKKNFFSLMFSILLQQPHSHLIFYNETTSVAMNYKQTPTSLPHFKRKE